MFTTNDKLCELFEIKPAARSFVLFRKCYNKAYATICGSQSKPCSSCGAKPKRGAVFAYIVQMLKQSRNIYHYQPIPDRM